MSAELVVPDRLKVRHPPSRSQCASSHVRPVVRRAACVRYPRAPARAPREPFEVPRQRRSPLPRGDGFGAARPRYTVSTSRCGSPPRTNQCEHVAQYGWCPKKGPRPSTKIPGTGSDPPVAHARRAVWHSVERFGSSRYGAARSRARARPAAQPDFRYTSSSHARSGRELFGPGESTTSPALICICRGPIPAAASRSKFALPGIF